jgi:chaperonin GroEL
MEPKDLFFAQEGRLKLISGIKKIAGAVKSTLGPYGNTVLIESPNHTHGITVTKDGVTVAKAVDLIDPVENLAVKMMKEAADRTATAAGDGTTTAIVLTEGLVLGWLEHIGTEQLNNTEVLRNISELSSKVIEGLKRKGKKVTNSMLLDVATISANNDSHIGRIIADVYKEVGKNGIVTVERSQTADTYAETTRGLHKPTVHQRSE